MRVWDYYQWLVHNFILSHGVRSVCSRDSVLWHASGGVFCVQYMCTPWRTLFEEPHRMHNSQHCSNVITFASGQGKKESFAYFSGTFFIVLSCLCWMSFSSTSLLSLHRPLFSLLGPSASTTLQDVEQIEPCASAHWSGMSGCWANPTSQTQFKIVYEHTQICNWVKFLLLDLIIIKAKTRNICMMAPLRACSSMS